MTARPGAYPHTTAVLGIASLVGTFVAMHLKEPLSAAAAIAALPGAAAAARSAGARLLPKRSLDASASDGALHG